MERPLESEPEHLKCRYWRSEIVKMTKAQVAQLTGFSVSSITDIENGENRSTKKAIDKQVMKRYRMACASVSLAADFTWLDISLDTDMPVKMRMSMWMRR
ncbi:helix-turn-helix protein [Rhizobium sp. PP-CC-3A-592]|nr:helix-turn-helix protein [Rhizobium sp. PP-CC-3A-592]